MGAGAMAEAERGEGSVASLWQSRNFLLLFSAQVISLLGSGVTTVGLALYTYRMVGEGSATAVIGNALMLRILAFLLFSQPAGVIADRVNRKWILVSADLLRFGLLSLFPFVTAVWQVYLLIFAINAVTAFFTPTFEASIPEVVGEERYVRAIALSRVAVDVEAVAAPALAGLLVSWIGVRWVFWFDAVTYVVSAILVILAAVPHVPRVTTPLSIWLFLSEITHGTRVLLREPSLRQALTLSLAEAAAGAAAIVATVAYVHDVLGRGDTTFSLLMALLGLGSSAAALALGRVTGRYEKRASDTASLHGARHRWAAVALLAGGFLLGVVLLPGYLTPPLAIFSLMWFLNGAGQALIAISSSTLLAEHTIEDERGRAYAAHFALTHACWLITYPAVGHASARWGTPATFTATGLVCILITGLALLVGRGARGEHAHSSGR